jgi:hypothetical protein
LRIFQSWQAGKLMAHTFTTLRHPVEKLLEAEHFLAALSRPSALVFQFELNAFLAASRSVTLFLQKSMQIPAAAFPVPTNPNASPA